MLRTAGLSLLALLASGALTLAGVGQPLAVEHLAFAVGIVPLIFAAILHFVPVLTRSGDPAPFFRHLPEVARLGGLLLVGALQGWLPFALRQLAIGLVALGAGLLLGWLWRRARRALGAPHPGWRWYAAGLAALLLALAALLAQPLSPAHWLAWRNLHLHLNTLGLVGLAAFGTLPLLLPTALGRPDPGAALWLRRRLPPFAAGVALLAAGSALGWPLALAGGSVLGLLAGELAAGWWRRFGAASLLGDGVASGLLAAVAGWLLALGGGALHGGGLLPARPTLFAWAAAFLLPLVTSALSQLLPVWRWPGPQTPARQAMRQRLAAGGAWRGAGWLLAGAAGLAARTELAGVLAGAALLAFVGGLVGAVRIRRSTR